MAKKIYTYNKMPFFEGTFYDMKIPEQRKEYNRLYHRVWAKQNRDKVNEYQRNYYSNYYNNKELVLSKLQAYIKSLPQEKRDEIKLKRATRAWIKYNFDPDHRFEKQIYNKWRYWCADGVRERERERYKERYANDEAFREKLKQYQKNRYAGFFE